MGMGVPAAAFCTVGVPAYAFQTVGVGGMRVPGDPAALRVFGGFQVAHFDVFLSCTHIR